MATKFELLKEELKRTPSHWLVTGAAGFIGSNLLEELLSLGQQVTALDNFATGHRHNLDDVRKCVGEAHWKNCKFIEGDIRDYDTCLKAAEGCDYVLHQAALGSVPRSLKDPISSHQANVNGMVHVFLAAREGGAKRIVHASSSSVYGDSGILPNKEERIGKPVSPYAATKFIDEVYAEVFSRVYELQYMALRYFNVFGPRQDPNGAYAAVIPRWIDTLLSGEAATINGDGTTTRDFCYIENVVQANLLAACTDNKEAVNQVYNIAVGGETSLKEILGIICDELEKHTDKNICRTPNFAPFRAGDVKNSRADTSKARELLGYDPRFRVREGLEKLVEWWIG